MDYDKPIFKKFTTISQLPSLPEVLLKIIQMCKQDTSSTAEVSGIIETDPSLSIRILRLVNSVQYALPHRVDSMRQAVNLIGMNTVKNLALCASVREVFVSTRKNGDFDLKGFWWHSLLNGLLAKRLAETCRYDKPEDAFLCGLFHDIGKLVLLTCFGDNYIQLLLEGAKQNEAPLNTELRVGVTHPEAGAWLLHYWGLPTFLSDGILYHHEPRSRISSAFPLVKVVFCAHELSLDACGQADREMAFRLVEEILGISTEDARSAFERALSELEGMAETLQITVKAPRPPKVGICNPDIDNVELACEVRDMSLLKGTLERLVTARDQADIVGILLEGIQIIFDRTRVLIFLFDDERNVFFCAPPPQDHKSFFSGSNTIPAEQSRSLIVRCMQENMPVNSFSEQGSLAPDRPIMDDQIIRYLGKEGIYCVPMRASCVGVGVLVMAMDASEQAFFKQQDNILVLFAQQAGLALLAEKMKRKHFDGIQQERLNSVYTFERKIVHEVRNPLSIIKNYLHILGLKIADQNIAQQEIRIIQEEIARVSNIVEQLSALSSNIGCLTNERIDINRMIRDLAKIMEKPLSVNSGVILHLDLESELPAVSASRDALKQVFINLIRNGAEAMKNGGDLTVKTRKLEAYDIKVNGTLEKTKAGLVEISVADNGEGIPESLLPRLFEPFVGTKKSGHSGLGLSIVHGLVNSCGGQVTGKNNPGGGSTFRLVFPAEPA